MKCVNLAKYKYQGYDKEVGMHQFVAMSNDEIILVTHAVGVDSNTKIRYMDNGECIIVKGEGKEPFAKSNVAFKRAFG